MISALIFSMNRTENVIRLSEKLKDYVDEIVILDQSEREQHERLKEKLPYAKIYYLPPIGVAEFYYKIGLELCQNDWVLHLDDDEEPSKALLVDLKELTKKGQVFSILRLNSKNKHYKPKLFRFFNKNYILPPGIIHLSWVSKAEPVELDEKYYIFHNEEDYNIRKLRRYAILESWQYGYKIFFSIFSPFIKFHTPNRVIKKFGEILWLQSKFGKIGWFLLSVEYNIYSLLSLLRNAKNLRWLIDSIIYILLIQFNVIRDFSKKQKTWLNMIEKGFFEFLGLDTYENALKNLKDLNSNDGIENFVKLLKLKLSEKQ